MKSPGWIVAAVLGVLCGCASSQHATSDTKVTPVAGGALVEVRLDDYVIHMPTTVPAGELTFQVRNVGSHRHTVAIEGGGVEAHLKPDLNQGESGELKVKLAPGTYRVWCPVGPHAAMGMRLSLTVKEP